MTRSPARYILRRRCGPRYVARPSPLGPWLRLLSIVAISAAFWGGLNVIARL